MSEDTKPCPVCAETIKAAAVKCRFCGTDLAALASAREAEIEKPLFVGHPAVIYSLGQWLVVALTLGVAYLVYWFKSASTTYEITTQSKPLGMRLVGQCLLHLRSSDAGFQTVILYGIPNLESLADTLRECSLRERSRRKVTTFVQA